MNIDENGHIEGLDNRKVALEVAQVIREYPAAYHQRTWFTADAARNLSGAPNGGLDLSRGHSSIMESEVAQWPCRSAACSAGHATAYALREGAVSRKDVRAAGIWKIGAAALGLTTPDEIERLFNGSATTASVLRDLDLIAAKGCLSSRA